MIETDCEIAAPDTIVSPEYPGQTIDLKGMTFRMYFVLTGKSQGQTIEALRKMQVDDLIPLDGELDTDSIPENNLRGVCFDMILSAEEREYRTEPTPEQKAQGKPGDVIEDAEGNPIKAGYNIRAFPGNIQGNPSREELPY
jgi:hypothetical protein